jgi:hypothetical protein
MNHPHLDLFAMLHDWAKHFEQSGVSVCRDSLGQKHEDPNRHEDGMKSEEFERPQLGEYSNNDHKRSEKQQRVEQDIAL